MKRIFILASAVLIICTNAFSQTQITKYLKKIKLENLNSGLIPIDCVYVLNLDSRREKWANAQSQFTTYNIFPNRVDAVNGWNLNAEDRAMLIDTLPSKLRGGQIGCILSHVSAIYHAYQNDFSIVWICEDDVEILEDPNVLDELIDKLSSIDPEWDVLFTDQESKNNLGQPVKSLGSQFRPGYPHKSLNYYTTSVKVDDDFIKKNQRFGCYSYILSKRGISKILNHFINNYLWTAYDIEIHYVPEIREYCLTKDLVSFNWRLPSDTEKQNN